VRTVVLVSLMVLMGGCIEREAAANAEPERASGTDIVEEHGNPRPLLVSGETKVTITNAQGNSSELSTGFTNCVRIVGEGE
jgi:hypothetical protein